MDEIELNGAAPKPLWKRIVDFPLVAMLLAVGLFALAVTVSVLIGRLLPAMDPQTSGIFKAVLAIALVWAVYKLAIAKLGDHPRDDLPVGEAPKGLGAGILVGFLLFSLVVGIAAVTDVYNIVGDGSTSGLVMALVGTAIVPGFMEEVLFRGILFRWLEEFAGSWIALALTSALFGFIHIFNPNASVLSSFAISIEAGVLLGGAYMLTRNLWMAIGLHAAWNFTQGFIFDVPVSGLDQNGLVEAKLSGPELLSGGTFGLEASIIAMIIATAAGLGLVLLAVKRGKAMSPWWVRRRLEAVPAT